MRGLHDQIIAFEHHAKDDATDKTSIDYQVVTTLIELLVIIASARRVFEPQDLLHLIGLEIDQNSELLHLIGLEIDQNSECEDG